MNYIKDLRLYNEDENKTVNAVIEICPGTSNKNELVVCLGMKDNTHIEWCNAFSWSDSPKIDLLTEQYFTENNTLDLKEYSNLVIENLNRGDWKRKEFSDFEYIRLELSNSQCIGLVILLLLYNIGISIYIITNQFKN